MEIISATSEEVQDVINDILERDITVQRRRELSDESFKEWLYNTVRTIFAKLGYQLQSFEDFWVDIGINIVTGWNEGREQARKENELKRKMRERKYR